jgi:cytoskeletal protein RodZ
MMRLRWELKVFMVLACLVFGQNLFAIKQVTASSSVPTASTSTESVSATAKTPLAATSNTPTEAARLSTVSTLPVTDTKSSPATNTLGAKLLDNAGTHGSYYPRVTVRDLTAGQREVSVVIANAKGDLQATVVRVDPQGNVVRLLLKRPVGNKKVDASIISQDGAVKVVDTPNVVIGSDGVLVDAPEDK